MGQGRHTLRSISDPVYPQNCLLLYRINTLLYTQTGDVSQIINAVTASKIPLSQIFIKKCSKMLKKLTKNSKRYKIVHSIEALARKSNATK